MPERAAGGVVSGGGKDGVIDLLLCDRQGLSVFKFMAGMVQFEREVRKFP